MCPGQRYADFIIQNIHPLVVIGVNALRAVTLGLVFHIVAALVLDGIVFSAIGDAHHHRVFATHYEARLNKAGRNFCGVPPSPLAGVKNGLANHIIAELVLAHGARAGVDGINTVSRTTGHEAKTENYQQKKYFFHVMPLAWTFGGVEQNRFGRFA